MTACFRYGLQDPNLFWDMTYHEISLFIKAGHERELADLKSRIVAILRGLSKKPFQGFKDSGQQTSTNGLNRRKLVRQWFFGGDAK